MFQRCAALALAAVVAFGLTACTAPDSPARGTGDAPGDGGQSVAEACRLIEDTIADATSEFQQTAAEDPVAVVDAMKAAAQTLSDSASQITNDDVAALLPGLQGMFEQVAELMAAVVEGDVTKTDDIAALGDRFSETSETFQELCGE
jgi:ABC-type amino acid transport substrate-binding protein